LVDDFIIISILTIYLIIEVMRMNITIFVSNKEKKLIDEIKKEAKRQGIGLGKYLLSLYKRTSNKDNKNE